jgi:hypothetical protein
LYKNFALITTFLIDGDWRKIMTTNFDFKCVDLTRMLDFFSRKHPDSQYTLIETGTSESRPYKEHDYALIAPTGKEIGIVSVVASTFGGDEGLEKLTLDVLRREGGLTGLFRKEKYTKLSKAGVTIECSYSRNVRTAKVIQAWINMGSLKKPINAIDAIYPANIFLQEGVIIQTSSDN